MKKILSLVSVVDRFAHRKILVIGDLMVDKFIWGTVSRISPEAPVPVVQVERETFAPGGAANVAKNLKALGAQVSLMGLVGKDQAGEQLLSDLSKLGIDSNAIVEEDSLPTTTKIRIIAHHQQVVRVDWDQKSLQDNGWEKKLLALLPDQVKAAEAVVISDYAKGVVSVSLAREAIRLAHLHQKWITVDPKPQHFKRYRGASCLTPNLAEALQGMGVHSAASQQEVEHLARNMMKVLQCRCVLITQGEKGMTICEKGRVVSLPASAREVFDVTGAGDTAISAFSLALASGADALTAAKISNAAGGIVVGKLGTATVTPQELKAALKSRGAG